VVVAALFIGWIPAAIVTAPVRPSGFQLSPILAAVFVVIATISIGAAIGDPSRSMRSRLLRVAIALGTTAVALRVLS
jgi:hypothetical protein